jgi:phenylpropionate dioxygenase-like ring-hydroxylating dioxygenase large terminal subunit
MVQVSKLVDLETGLVSRKIFSDEEIYQQELERVFRRCWLFLGHDSMLPQPGDYLTTYMAEDPVLVIRDPDGAVRAFLNTCPHRGNKVCLFDSGHASTFTCSYHGWSFNSEGKLTGVPFYQEAYYGELDKEQWGLVKVPHVARYGGLVFGAWDPVMGLDEYLGDLRWYLDKLLLAEDSGGLEVLPGCQRYRMMGNWKIACDNFAGDHYHTHFAHASALKLEMRGISIYENASAPRDGQPQGRQGYFEIALDPAHGLGGIYTSTEPYERDLARAQEIGPEVAEWVTERYRRLQERLKETPAKPYGFAHGNCFPTLNWTGASTVFRGRGFYLWHPRGPHESEVWQWCFVERDAPRVVKDIAAMDFARHQSAAGFMGQDDYENFERVTENTLTATAQQLPFHYGMKLGYDGRWRGQEEWDTAGLPGLVGPRFTETNQRRFYQYWAKLMDLS